MSTDNPIVYPLAETPPQAAASAALLAAPGLLTCTRALEGMQKEAVVIDEATQQAWRVLCDEGPWLNGTDLAPFPLGYFVGGLASCVLADVTAVATDRGVPSGDLALRVDIHFTMEGSILRGTMAAGVDSIEVKPAGAARKDVASLLSESLHNGSAVASMLAAHLPSRFLVHVNGEIVDWPGSPAGALSKAGDPAALFERLSPADNAGTSEPLVHKAAEAAENEGAVGLKGEQKRSVHIAADVRVRPDGLHEISALCVQPAGSRFVLLASGNRDDARAPTGAAYLSAGIAFCFMTQLGRYAQIRKLPLSGYRIVQRTAFCADAPSPVETAVFLDSEDTHESNLKMVQMGEQTCYVHTTLREPQTIEVGEMAGATGA